MHGTTGYNYLNDLNGLYIDTRQARQVRRAYARLTGQIEPFDDVLYESKRLIIETALASELTVLTHALDRIAQSSRRSRDFTRDSLRDVTLPDRVAYWGVGVPARRRTAPAATGR